MEEDIEQFDFESYESVSTLTEEKEYRRETITSYKDSLRTTEELIRETQEELCLIKLCWPEVDRTKDLYLKTLPSSYCTLSDKEKLLAWYAENFRQQFHAKYPTRRPLLLVCENECGLQVSKS
ncbi:Coiled-coil domain-containing protein lobo [Habropoda laboriosa]|uniref:Coiled-coil domain-containing protein lobo n=1 Tax=Habropoda laboriosa TaxID=597456 RepID=A0A0L7R1S0_9HYME|nr:Coiled-coil domain-containing protein lobo [Habropoda laboriosa]